MEITHSTSKCQDCGVTNALFAIVLLVVSALMLYPDRENFSFYSATLEQMNVSPGNNGNEKERIPEAESSQRKGTWPFMGAAVRGKVEKKGVVPPEYYSEEFQESRQTAFRSWMKAYVNGSQPRWGSALPFPQCQVHVNHQYRFIWIRGFKVGTTSMRGPLRWLCDSMWAVPKDADLSACSVGLHIGRNFTRADVDRWWREYFVFGVIRNPYSRFASAEHYIKSLLPDECKKPSFSEVCREPYLDARICFQDSCCNPVWSKHHYQHFAAQSECLFDQNLNPVVDFLGEVENIQEDFNTIVAEINKRRDPAYPPLNSTKLKRENGRADRRLAEKRDYVHDLFKEHEPCLTEVAEFYNRDFDLLGYERLEQLE